jgi:hypothetical protein
MSLSLPTNSSSTVIGSWLSSEWSVDFSRIADVQVAEIDIGCQSPL